MKRHAKLDVNNFFVYFALKFLKKTEWNVACLPPLCSSDRPSKSPNHLPTKPADRPIGCFEYHGVLVYDLTTGRPQYQYLTTLVADSCCREVNTTLINQKKSRLRMINWDKMVFWVQSNIWSIFMKRTNLYVRKKLIYHWVFWVYVKTRVNFISREKKRNQSFWN